MKPLYGLFVSLSLASAGLPLHAEQATTVYNCGNGVYGTTPCPGGQVVKPAPEPSPMQRQEAAQVAKRDAALGQDLAKDREKMEQANSHPAPKSLVIPMEPTAAGASTAQGKRAKHAAKHKKVGAKKAPPRAKKHSAKKPKGAASGARQSGGPNKAKVGPNS